MTHAMRAAKERGAKIVAVDVYMNATMSRPTWRFCKATAPTARSPAR
jgi:pheromone shutdown protein TraB